MTPEELIKEKVLSIVSLSLKIPKAEIKLEDELIALVKDSIQLFELLVSFEKELGRKVKYEEISKIEKVSDVIEYAKSIGYVAETV